MAKCLLFKTVIRIFHQEEVEWEISVYGIPYCLGFTWRDDSWISCHYSPHRVGFRVIHGS